MRIFVGGIAMSPPLVEVSEAVAIGVLRSTFASAMGRPNCSNHSLGTGGCTSVVCNVTGRPFAPMKCLSGTKSPERPLKVHCAGWRMACAASCSAVAFGNRPAFLAGGDDRKAAKLSANSSCFAR